MERSNPEKDAALPQVEMVVEMGPGRVGRFPLSLPRVTIGRAAGNTLVIPDEAVSRVHAQITWDGAQFVLEDLGSTNGTAVNGERLTAPRVLHRGDQIRLGGSVSLMLEPAGAAAMPVTAASLGGAPVTAGPTSGAATQRTQPAQDPPRRKRAVVWVVAALAVACLMAGLTGGGVWGYRELKRRALDDRPLVLIKAPFNHEQMGWGRSVLTFASARAPSGVARIELWADGELVAERASAQEGGQSPLILSTGWTPRTSGPHALVVRAVSERGTVGQSSVAITSLGRVFGGTEDRTVQQGETLEAIAKELGIGVDELKELNPEVDPSEELEPGDVVVIPAPDTEADSAGEDAPGGEAGEGTEEGAEPPEAPSGVELGDAPDPGGAAEPGSFASILEILGIHWPILEWLAPSEPTDLRFEALGLLTDQAYSGVHCYVRVTDGLPQWHPDRDGDQTTFESFASLGGGHWDVAAELSGAAAPALSWPDDQPLPLEVLCVAELGGGAGAVDLGTLALNLAPAQWDGTTRQATSAGGAGWFQLDYRIGSADGAPRGYAAWLDPSLYPPQNLRLIHAAGDSWHLGWEYDVPEDWEEAEIIGFRVYLNNTLQWTVGPDTHFTQLPRQWARPPCGDIYNLHVTAFTAEGCPDCRESPASNRVQTASGEAGDSACTRRVVVTFDHLSTGDLGGDGRYDPGDVGPVHGAVYVSEERLSFSGLGMTHWTAYDISWLTRHYGGGANNRLIVEIPPENDYVEVGFDVTDSDTGIGARDDPVCSGGVLFDVERMSAGVIDTRSPADAPTDRCILVYSLSPSFDSPAGEAGAPPPLPDLRVERMSVREPGGLINVHVRNQGGAAWSAHDLQVELIDPEGATVATQIWPAFSLEPGERAVLESEWAPERPMGHCVILDAQDAVLEEPEAAGFDSRVAFCSELPDLIVTDSYYDGTHSLLYVTVQNASTVDLETADIPLGLEIGGVMMPPAPPAPGTEEADAIRLGPWDTRVFTISRVNAGVREQMRDGYTVIVDPGDQLAESDEANNRFAVRAAETVQLVWMQVSTHYYPWYRRSDAPQEQTFSMWMSVLAGRTGRLSRDAVAWTFGPREVERGEIYNSAPAHEADLVLYGDEWLGVGVQNVLDYRLHHEILGSASEVFGPDEDWGSLATVGSDQNCRLLGAPIIEGSRRIAVLPPSPWTSCGAWMVYYRICLVE